MDDQCVREGGGEEGGREEGERQGDGGEREGETLVLALGSRGASLTDFGDVQVRELVRAFRSLRSRVWSV